MGRQHPNIDCNGRFGSKKIFYGKMGSRNDSVLFEEKEFVDRIKKYSKSLALLRMDEIGGERVKGLEFTYSLILTHMYVCMGGILAFSVSYGRSRIFST